MRMKKIFRKKTKKDFSSKKILLQFGKKNEIITNWEKVANLRQNADEIVIFLENAFWDQNLSFLRNPQFSYN